MTVLKHGSTGPDVQVLQKFLRIEGLYMGSIDGIFGTKTEIAVGLFQGKHGLLSDRVAGPITLAKMRERGLRLPSDIDTMPAVHPNGMDILARPVPPTDFHSLSETARETIFGKFEWKPVGSLGDIQILGDWQKTHITTVTVSELVNVEGCPGGHVTCHVLAASPIRELFAAWKTAGLLSRVKTWAGCYVPRKIRGSSGGSATNLSNHAWGTAFDINAAWHLPLGRKDPSSGTPGSTWELVNIAASLGWYWGGWFERKDGMHFERAR